MFLIALYDLKKLVNHPSCHIKTDSTTEVNNPCVLTRNFDLSMLLIIHTIWAQTLILKSAKKLGEGPDPHSPASEEKQWSKLQNSPSS